MKLLRKLIPAFLWQWDLWLLQNQPRLWSTRVHLHLWFLLLCNALALVFGMLINVNPRKFPDPEELFAYMLVPTIAYAAFWVYRVVRFNAEKRFGTRKTYSEVGELMVLWVSALLIMSIPTTLSVTVGLRIAALTPDEEFVAEVDHLGGQLEWFYRGFSYHDPYYDEREYEDDYRYNDNVAAIEEAVHTARIAVEDAGSDQSREPQGSGSHKFFSSVKEYRLRKSTEHREPYYLHDEYSRWIHLGNNALDRDDTLRYNPDTAAYYFARADSVERNCPLLLIDFAALRPQSEKLLFKTDSVLEQEYLSRFERREPMNAERIERALAIAHKYTRRARLLGAAQVADEFKARQPSTANLEACVNQLARIARAKDLRYFFVNEQGYYSLIVIFSFCLALLISAFKRIYWQPFLIAIVTGAVVPIVVLIIALILEHDVIRLDGDSIMIHMHWIIAAFLLIMLFTIGGLKAYRTNRAVMVLLANVIVPFFAVFTLAILHHEYDVFGEDALSNEIRAIAESNHEDPRIPALEQQWSDLRALVNWIMLCTLWGGIALYVLVLHPIFTRLYARLMALPERS